MRLLVDCSDISLRDTGTGIQRVFHARFDYLASQNSAAFSIVPIYASKCLPFYLHCDFSHADNGRYTFRRTIRPVRPRLGDVFFALDYHSYIQTSQARFFRKLKTKSIPIAFLVHDALPYTNPEWFPGDPLRRRRHWIKYLHVLSLADLIFAVSEATADVLRAWFRDNCQTSCPDIIVIPNGADIGSAAGAESIKKEESGFKDQLADKWGFLMVGTLEPRKGHQTVLDAFNILWLDSSNPASLVIVGKQGWMVEGLVSALQSQPESGKRLHWLQNVDDAQLRKLYRSSSCLLAASYGEGFGLPIVEATAHGLPVIARDIPVFREVGGNWPTYFNSDDPKQLAEVVSKWCQDNPSGGAKRTPPRLPTWDETGQEMLNALVELHNESAARG